MLFLIDVSVIDPINGRIKWSLKNDALAVAHNDEIMATNGILALDGVFSLNAIISFRIHSTTSIIVEFIIIYKTSASANFSSFSDYVGAMF